MGKLKQFFNVKQKIIAHLINQREEKMILIEIKNLVFVI